MITKEDIDSVDKDKISILNKQDSKLDLPLALFDRDSDKTQYLIYKIDGTVETKIME